MTQNLAPGDIAPPSPQPEEQAQSVRVSGPASLLALVPHLLGFQPTDSVVVIGTAPPTGQIRLTLRYDLPDPPDEEIAREIARHATEVLAAQELQTAAVAGYGSGPAVTPVADALRERAGQAGLEITEMLRAENGLYWSYVCANPRCCAPEGTPYTADHPAVEALAASRGPVLASREDLAATLAPASGADAEIMAEATRRAEEHALSLIDRVTRTGRRASARHLIGVAGVEAVTAAIALYQDGEEIPAGHGAAWLTVVLQDLRVRDDAWCRMDPEHRKENLRLWTDLTRLAQPGYVSAPASLLAFVAWQSGNGALANVALDRALNDNPRYRMAQLLRQAIDSGAPPSLARIPMTPEEVAASYEEAGYGTGDEDDADRAGDES
ncbi:MAG: DUF4192 domain-containing protein [Streptosporangiales bacterium]|nr:DUF4192 domain-containing protein [Streptosporangiales bacterium]